MNQQHHILLLNNSFIARMLIVLVFAMNLTGTALFKTCWMQIWLRLLSLEVQVKKKVVIFCRFCAWNLIQFAIHFTIKLFLMIAYFVIF